MEKNAPYGTYDDYILELKQDRYVENDPSKNCKNYPTRKHKSYNVCDREFVRRTLTKHFGSEFVPFWATDDLDNVTSEPVKFTSQYVSYQLGKLVIGMDTSDCPLPCIHSWKKNCSVCSSIHIFGVKFPRQISDNRFSSSFLLPPICLRVFLAAPSEFSELSGIFSYASSIILRLGS